MIVPIVGAIYYDPGLDKTLNLRENSHIVNCSHTFCYPNVISTQPWKNLDHAKRRARLGSLLLNLLKVCQLPSLQPLLAVYLP